MTKSDNSTVWVDYGDLPRPTHIPRIPVDDQAKPSCIYCGTARQRNLILYKEKGIPAVHICFRCDNILDLGGIPPTNPRMSRDEINESVHRLRLGK